ncbi:hypothetical protein [Erwinia sp. HR93]
MSRLFGYPVGNVIAISCYEAFYLAETGDFAIFSRNFFCLNFR